MSHLELTRNTEYICLNLQYSETPPQYKSLLTLDTISFHESTSFSNFFEYLLNSQQLTNSHKFRRKFIPKHAKSTNSTSIFQYSSNIAIIAKVAQHTFHVFFVSLFINFFFLLDKHTTLEIFCENSVMILEKWSVHLSTDNFFCEKNS